MVASRIEFRRSLPTRIISVGTPSMGPMTACCENDDARGRARELENTRPVATAVTSEARHRLDDHDRFAATLVGYIEP